MNFLSGLKVKIIAVLALITAYFAAKSKYQSLKIENLEEENEALGEVVEITAEMQEAINKEKEVVQNEEANNDGSDWHGNI